MLRYRGQPLLDNALCQAAVALDSGALPFPRHRALLVQWELDRHAKGSPSGRAVTEVTERVKTFRRIKQKNIGKTVDIPDENGYYITVARPTQG